MAGQIPEPNDRTPADLWSVWRVDDNGNVFLVKDHLPRAEAERLVAEFTTRGHKQMYWCEPENVEYDGRFNEFINAALSENIAVMQAMLDAGFDISSANEHGETAFSYCCANNKLESAKFLFTRGANINTVDKGGGTPLDWAVCQSSPEFREWLAGVGGKRNTDHEPWPWPLTGR